MRKLVDLLRAALSPDDQAEWHEDDRLVPLQVVPSRTAPSRFLLLTKLGQFERRLGTDRLPESWGLLARYGLPCVEMYATLRHLVKDAEILCFLGDLDPLDLTVFLELRDNVDHRLRHVGVSEPLLALMDRNSKTSRPVVESLAIPMTAFEVRHWNLLKSLAPEISTMLGPRATSLLDGGRKVELDAVLNPIVYSDSHCDDVCAVVFGSV